jgi:ssRNA-specific RNase YbeY (16S rRNA maturation enzyme)
MIHGVLHLLGFKDKSPAAKKAMRAAEDRALALFAQKL